MVDRILEWLKGEPVQFGGITYIFPHGQGIIRGYYKEFVKDHNRIVKMTAEERAAKKAIIDWGAIG